MGITAITPPAEFPASTIYIDVFMRDLTDISKFYASRFNESDLLTRLILQEYFTSAIFQQLAQLSMRDQRRSHPVMFMTSTAYVLHQWLAT